MSVSELTIKERLASFAKDYETALAEMLAQPEDAPVTIGEAMRYSVLAPGKRFRPFLVTRCCELVGGTFEDAKGPAAAIECVHAFSLIHDDLPAMDDDDLRRGRPTNHKIYGEAIAILAGDALLSEAFNLIIRYVKDPARAASIVGELASGTGWTGMIGGQTADIEGEVLPPDIERVKYIHNKKTAALLITSCRMGAIAGGADEHTIERLGEYGRHIGLAFQIADDLLDVTATTEVMGKATGKDSEAGKQTYPECLGIDASREEAKNQVEAALECLAPYGDNARDLADLARYCVERSY